MKLKDINKERVEIKRGEQKQIPVNEEIKAALKRVKSKDESQAETINRVLKTNAQMTDLLITMVESMETVPDKMSNLLMIIPEKLRNLFEAIVNEKKTRNKKQSKD